MRQVRRGAVRRAARLAAVGGLLAGTVLVSRAVASEPAGPAPPTQAVTAPSSAGVGLVARLGPARTAGQWTGPGGRTVVAVTDDAAGAEVRRAGAEARLVRHSMRELRSATARLRAAPRVSGTAWALDYRANEVVVRGDSTVSGADWTRLTGIARGIGDFVRGERVAGAFTTRLAGAGPIRSATGRCSAGFDVTDGTRDFVLTAGHCGPTGTLWSAGKDGGRLGTTVAAGFPGDDFSLIAYASGTAGSGAGVVAVGGGKGVRITGAGEPAVGQRVFRSGSTSGLRDGRVTALDATVNYPEGTVTGLVQTDVCAEPGDSGGPLFSEGIALGLTSGGSGDCLRGGTTFFQPLTEALTSLGVRLLVAPTREAGPVPARPTGRRALGPGMLVVAGSLIALAAGLPRRRKRSPGRRGQAAPAHSMTSR
ncbi:S1 family peptidase [Streptomyces sp. NPDC048182]|uniref:S1 family peptidase n=1 Tax=Streptomyces sp. NPDC048182 TaxID=3365507 RepID=UPI00371A2DEA